MADKSGVSWGEQFLQLCFSDQKIQGRDIIGDWKGHTWVNMFGAAMGKWKGKWKASHPGLQQRGRPLNNEHVYCSNGNWEVQQGLKQWESESERQAIQNWIARPEQWTRLLLQWELTSATRIEARGRPEHWTRLLMQVKVKLRVTPKQWTCLLLLQVKVKSEWCNKADILKFKPTVKLYAI